MHEPFDHKTPLPAGHRTGVWILVVLSVLVFLLALRQRQTSDPLPETAAATSVPSLIIWTDGTSDLPRYSYSVGLVSSRDENNQLSAIATITAADAPLRVVFNDGFSQFWDGLYIESGDIRRDERLAYRRDFGPRFAVDMATTAGTATPQQF